MEKHGWFSPTKKILQDPNLFNLQDESFSGLHSLTGPFDIDKITASIKVTTGSSADSRCNGIKKSLGACAQWKCCPLPRSSPNKEFSSKEVNHLDSKTYIKVVDEAFDNKLAAANPDSKWIVASVLTQN